ncbi:hypothetical protein DPMN_090030 [Dreissena polymorpha]|uniref:Uncharacterized protein n=1 Tax=Dreissena polymorpha TaxID=45954 RepID=A0A9D4KY12_DREPO|nr:hypothetical protein DPMN_090030 [Dreissena polymorpha]
MGVDLNDYGYDREQLKKFHGINNYGKFHGSGSCVNGDKAFQLNTPKHFQDMAPDGRKDGRTDNAKTFAHLRGTNILVNSHVIQLTGTIFSLDSRIKETNVLSKFHENWAKNVTSTKNAPPTGGHVFSPIPTIFKLVRDINKTNVLTTFHDDWAKIVTSRVFTRENCHYIHIEKNAPPTGGHVFSPISTIFELA